MVINSKGLHHFNIRKRVHQKHEPYPHPDKLKRFWDKMIYIIVILGPIACLPQLLKVWLYKNATSVSSLSWFGFSIFSLVWLIYGILHKEKPIIFMNLGLITIQALIAVGAILYS